jgi:ArsR family transcriptional regulator, arsenate/arsenite/antimonite-responsive transcriptional repressor
MGTKSKAQPVPFKPTSPLKASPRTINGLVRVFKLLADESRLMILLALARHGELHVSALCELLNQPQPTVSHQLTLLRMAGLASFRRHGKRNYYRIESRLAGQLVEQFFAESGNGRMQVTFEDFSVAYQPSK